jgi:hypothetical protein
MLLASRFSLMRALVRFHSRAAACALMRGAFVRAAEGYERSAHFE